MINFIQHKGIAVPLDIANIDTDAIISKQFLQKITRDNFGQYLFSNWRFLDPLCKQLNYNFVLNNPNYQNASILVTRENFGCGSSREHAVWALIDYGFRVILAPSFADIFYTNSINNRLLLISLSELEIDKLFKKIYSQQKNTFLTIDLQEQKIYVEEEVYLFNIDDFYRDCMIYNLDHIGWTLTYKSDIKEYEQNQLAFLE
ncbi:3-isopropylmalate dehydratase small subunit [Blochmannia endosymbiont of Camponotus (Colobopsis) obliquus]|uniref:3-isopropylmalate dehydratase small subunit n=1 Tax=Blochmannia endosymbiont of Camponotus (Colobopsis) obliquus TaxID=1505597 RepID=UPI00061A5478|nr:3-isopropylmalate dehydratase small subunit [Blochmannia endosymbiont of Camponotus (Colobopsis) obliquus]AKC60308.1 3-isopropylmalate dehydratase small subunit [Blochmannia endosymbiont of Camponotus (Colobopsis) obliquus]